MTMTSHVRRPSGVRYAFLTSARAFCVLVVPFVGGCGSTPVVELGENLENGATTGAPSAKDAGRADASSSAGGGGDAGRVPGAGGAGGTVTGSQNTPLVVGPSFTCALKNGGVRCWGSNVNGMLGNGSMVDSKRPVNVVGLSSGVISISAGSNHACALTSAGAVKCWGGNVEGQLGNGGFQNWSLVPVDVVGLSSGVTALSAGANHTCALVAGAVQCWGDNHNEQLGKSTFNGPFSRAPIVATGLTSGVLGIFAGDDTSVALTSSHGLKRWGFDYGSSTIDAPSDLDGLTSGVASVSVGSEHLCVVTLTGAAKCYGRNERGGLGNGTTTPGLVDVSGLSSGVRSVAAGWDQSCAVTVAGAASCWGNAGTDGLLGNAGKASSLVPLGVSGLATGVTQIAVANALDHACAMLGSGTVKCWGKNTYGQLGNGGTTNSPTPVSVVGL